MVIAKHPVTELPLLPPTSHHMYWDEEHSLTLTAEGTAVIVFTIHTHSQPSVTCMRILLFEKEEEWEWTSSSEASLIEGMGKSCIGTACRADSNQSTRSTFIYMHVWEDIHIYYACVRRLGTSASPAGSLPATEFLLGPCEHTCGPDQSALQSCPLSAPSFMKSMYTHGDSSITQDLPCDSQLFELLQSTCTRAYFTSNLTFTLTSGAAVWMKLCMWSCDITCDPTSLSPIPCTLHMWPCQGHCRGLGWGAGWEWHWEPYQSQYTEHTGGCHHPDTMWGKKLLILTIIMWAE